ncbi:MAG: YqiA/YcfP family alpha/beta fold hydrolase [Myxococcales bacterium]
MLLYLHGFASSPGSFKARVFHARLAESGEELLVPAMDEGDFEHLTLTRQLALVERLSRGARPLAVIGSSMGGYLAALHASAHPVDALVLMAPAVDFCRRWEEKVGQTDLERWRRDGLTEVDHVAQGRKVPLRYDLMVDAARHEPWPRVSCPALVFQGNRDDVVPPERVQRWVAMNPSARLVMLESGHELTDVAEGIADEALRFLATVPELARAHSGLALPAQR